MKKLRRKQIAQFDPASTFAEKKNKKRIKNVYDTNEKMSKVFTNIKKKACEKT